MKIIYLEGINGCGKTSIVKQLTKTVKNSIGFKLPFDDKATYDLILHILRTGEYCDQLPMLFTANRIAFETYLHSGSCDVTFIDRSVYSQIHALIHNNKQANFENIVSAVNEIIEFEKSLGIEMPTNVVYVEREQAVNKVGDIHENFAEQQLALQVFRHFCKLNNWLFVDNNGTIDEAVDYIIENMKLVV